MATIRLSLRQNAIHTLYHAVEHLYWSESESDAKEGRSYDHDERTVEWRNESGHISFPLSDFTRLPAVYSLRFALLHLIQAAELLLKAYVERCDPEALFVKPGSRRTIDLRTALDFTMERNPTLLSRAEYALLLEAKDFRNWLEHYELGWEESKFRTLCADVLAICVLLSQALLSFNLVDEFSWDWLCDKPDPIAQYLSTALVRASAMGQDVTRRSGDLWASAHSEQPVFLCLNCGARAVSQERGVCMGCSADRSEEVVSLMEDWAESERKIIQLQALLAPSTKSSSTQKSLGPQGVVGRSGK